MRLQVLSRYYLLSNESQRSLLLHPSFWSYPACLVVVGRTGEASAYVLAPQRKVRNEPFLRSHLCTGGVREMGTVVCYHQLMSQQTISKPLCIFFFYFDASCHLFSRTKSTYANICQEQERKANWAGRLKWASVFNSILFYMLVEQDL